MKSAFDFKKRFMADKSEKPAPPAPVQQAPANEYYYQGANQVGSRVWSPAANAFETRVTQTPEQQQVMDISQSMLGQIAEAAAPYVNMDEAARQDLANRYAAPAVSAINSTYDKLQGGAESQAASSGIQNSFGYARFLADEIAKNKAQDLSDVTTQAYFAAPDVFLSPLLTGANLYNSLLTGEQAAMGNLNAQLLSGSQLGEQQLQGMRGAQSIQAQLDGQRNASRKKSFFNKLLSPFG